MKPLCLFTIKPHSWNERHYSYGIDMRNDFGSLIVLPDVRMNTGRFTGHQRNWRCLV